MSIHARRDLRSPRRPAPFAAPRYDPESFERFSEGIARAIGSARFLVTLIVVVAVWLGAHRLTGTWDPELVWLDLVLSGVAAFAAPLIMIAHARQAERDRADAERDRSTTARTLADTEFLARELAAVRLSLGEVATRDYLDERLETVQRELAALREQLAADTSSRSRP